MAEFTFPAGLQDTQSAYLLE